MIRQRLSLGVITFRDRLKEGIATCVAGEVLLENGPADRRAVLERRELMADGRGIRPKPAKGSFLLWPSGWRRVSRSAPAGIDAFLLDALHERVSASQKHDRAGGDSVRGDEWADVLLTGAVARDDLVRKRQLIPRDRA